MTAPILILLFLVYVPLPMNRVVTHYTYGDKEVLCVDNNNTNEGCTYLYLVEDGKRSAPLKIVRTIQTDWYWDGTIIFRDSVYFCPESELIQVICDTTTDFRLFVLNREADNYWTIMDDTTAGRQIFVSRYHNDDFHYAKCYNMKLNSAVVERSEGGYEEWPFWRQIPYIINWAKVNAKVDTTNAKAL